MDYREAIVASVAIIERACMHDDLCNLDRHTLGHIILDVYDTLRDAVAPDWWERDTEAEDEQKQRILDAM